MSRQTALAAVGALLVCAGLDVRGRADILSYDLPAAITLREPIVLDVTVHNDTRGLMTVDLGESCVSQFGFDLTRPDGSHVVAHPRGINDRAQGVGFEALTKFRLEANATSSCWVVLNQFLDFPTVGSYRLSIQFDGQVESQVPIQVTRNTSRTIQVLARDDAALRSICARLVADSQVDRPVRAIRALAWINDPIAIPYLLEAAALDPIAVEEIEALVRIGGPEARGALQTLATSRNQWTAEMAKGALNRIR